MKQQRIKHSIRALACNFLDFDDKRLHDDHKRIKIIKELNGKYVIVKPDKSNGVVLLKKVDYISSMTELFADRTKFRKVDKNNITNLLKNVTQPRRN